MSSPEEALTHSNLEGRHRGLALFVICCAQLMIILDATVVNVALPTIRRDLHFSYSSLTWLVTAYSLTFGGLLLFGGRTGDLFGKRRMFSIGVAVFAVSSLLGGFAPAGWWLIITRGLQGVGGAIAAPTALALITTNFEEGPVRNRAMGVYAAMSGAGGALGLLLGGLLTSYASWRWIFFINVPIGALVLFLTPRTLNESVATSGRLDVPGAVTATGGMLSLVFGLSNASTHSWTTPSTFVPLIVAAVLLGAFLYVETRAPEPLMPLYIFRNRNRSGAYGMMFCVGIAMFAMFYFLTLYLQNILHYSPIRTGVGFLPMTCGIILSATLASQMMSRIGIRTLLVIGPAAAAVGSIWLTRITIHSSYVSILLPLVIIAIGMGFSFVPLTLTTVSGVRPHEAGLASALLNTMQQVGGALGLAILSTIAISATTNRLAAVGHAITPTLSAEATVHGYVIAFYGCTGFALAGLLISLLAIRRPAPVAEGAEALATLV